MKQGGEVGEQAAVYRIQVCVKITLPASTSPAFETQHVFCCSSFLSPRLLLRQRGRERTKITITTESHYRLKFGASLVLGNLAFVIAQTIGIRDSSFHVKLISDASLWGCDMMKWEIC